MKRKKPLGAHWFEPIYKTADRKVTIQSEGEGRGPSNWSLRVWPNLGEQFAPSSGPERSMKSPFFIIGPRPNTENLKDHTTENKCNYATISNFRVRRTIQRKIA